MTDAGTLPPTLDGVEAHLSATDAIAIASSLAVASGGSIAASSFAVRASFDDFAFDPGISIGPAVFSVAVDALFGSDRISVGFTSELELGVSHTSGSTIFASDALPLPTELYVSIAQGASFLLVLELDREASLVRGSLDVPGSGALTLPALGVDLGSQPLDATRVVALLLEPAGSGTASIDVDLTRFETFVPDGAPLPVPAAGLAGRVLLAVAMLGLAVRRARRLANS
jgi:hypothetical protein